VDVTIQAGGANGDGLPAEAIDAEGFDLAQASYGEISGEMSDAILGVPGRWRRNRDRCTQLRRGPNARGRCGALLEDRSSALFRQEILVGAPHFLFPLREENRT
jgi:hypothetical protein